MKEVQNMSHEVMKYVNPLYPFILIRLIKLHSLYSIANPVLVTQHFNL